MSDVKQVKVDNWGIYFLQRLKHFFNRTDYCDLTLQFQDNAQLKVHRLVLSACTEYFELLERTCEMYEDCLVMPDDLQADVVVPIVNFMYTGHLEFRMDLLERLYQTSQILNMPVLSKLLESHRLALSKPTPHSYSACKRYQVKPNETTKPVKATTSNKRSYSKAFDNNIVYRDKKVYHSNKVLDHTNSPSSFRPASPSPLEHSVCNKKSVLVDPRPTRYELPEELDNDNIFDNSFCNISYACKPLMIHPDNLKRYSSKRSGIFSEASSSKKLLPGTSTIDIVECKKISKDDNIFEDNMPDHNLNDDLDIFNQSYNNETKDSNQLFDQILDDGPKVTIETKDSKAASNLDHAKIISEVLKKYPHLVKSNKNIKLKILNTPSKGKKQLKPSPTHVEEKPKPKNEERDYTYETDVLDSQQAAKLIALGAENTKGPWICLICGTPGKALHFTSYYKFRRHLVEVHNEKPVPNICEYCGLRSHKRNYLLHHLYSQHGVEPPPQYNFPKCNRCSYIALTEGLLVKHKMTHKDVTAFRCNVCSAPFSTTKQLLQHIQATGHKYSAERKTNLQCIYCLKAFLRDGNLYAHLKTYHKKEAKRDGIIEDSDDEKPTEAIQRQKPDNREKFHNIKFEPSTSYDNDYEDVDVQYQIQQRHGGDIQVTPRKHHNIVSNQKQKILNPGFGSTKPVQKPKPIRKPSPLPEPSNFLDINIPSPPTTNHNEDEIVLIDNTEYIMRENQLIPRKGKSGNEYIISDMIDSASLQAVQPTTSMEYTSVHNAKLLEDAQASVLMTKKTSNINQPIQIVVSNEEEYKALLASNHPILFDNGDANKTLTVLTAPHNSATMQSATIDLDNTQSNDMMIIQEDFPLNVTEAVSTDNSNIVVVYSHPVDDQNKQFQILTTGGIGSQFVQSSAIITQNYETVTTTAPVMSAHVLESQPDTTWQDTIQSANCQTVQLNSKTVLQNVVHSVEINSLENVTEDNLNELPDVHLAPVPQTMLRQENCNNTGTDELNSVASEHINQQAADIVEESHNMSMAQTPPDILSSNIVEETSAMAEPMDISNENEIIPDHVSNEIISEVESNEIIADSVNNEIIPESVHNEIIPECVDNEIITVSVNNNINHEPLIEATMETENIVEQTEPTVADMVSQEDQPMETLAMTTENSEIAENILNNSVQVEEPLPESQAYDDIVDINYATKEDPQTEPKEPEQKIQNLTSEWSEDEYDIPEDIPTAVQKDPAAAQVATRQESEELEETIENIQQEVLNHVITTSTISATIEPISEVETEESENSISEDAVLEASVNSTTIQEPQALPVAEQVTAVENDPEAQEKISSLLNDWEDNDSQENNSQDENDSNVPAVENNVDLNDATIGKTTNTENIKSLVSDWDDDEEEIKE